MRSYLKIFHLMILSVVTSSFVCLAIIFTYEVFTYEETIELTFLNSVLFFSIPLVFSHRLYFLEHGFRNRFWGRILQNFMIVICSSMLCMVATFHMGTFYIIGSFPNLFLMAIFGIMQTEFVLSIINRFFISIKYYVW